MVFLQVIVAKNNLNFLNQLLEMNQKFVYSLNLPKYAHCSHWFTDRFGDYWKQANETYIEEMGYVSPDHGQPGTSSRKKDVFAFGVLLLELLTGKKAFDRYVFVFYISSVFFFFLSFRLLTQHIGGLIE